MYRHVLLILLLCISLPAAARMYQWVDPETGTTQLSGKPPVWYRSEAGGPRVLVFDKGRLVDDTGIRVSEVERDRLRQQALVLVEQDREEAREKLKEAKRMKALAGERGEDAEQADETPMAEIEPEPEAKPEPEEEEEAERSAEAMRELIREWEERRTQKARDVIQSGTRDGKRPPPENATSD